MIDAVTRSSAAVPAASVLRRTTAWIWSCGLAIPLVLVGFLPAVDAKVICPAAPVEPHTVAKLARSIDGRIVRSFGVTYNPITGRAAMHEGVDLVGRPGVPVPAMLSGRATRIRTGHGLGVDLLVRSGARAVLYRHIVHSAANGACVRAGQTVGLLGRSRGEARLHFEMWVNDRPVDPLRDFGR